MLAVVIVRLVLPDGPQQQLEQQPWRVVQQVSRLQQQVTIRPKTQAGMHCAIFAAHLDEAAQGAALSRQAAQPQFTGFSQQGEGPTQGRRVFKVGPIEEVILLCEPACWQNWSNSCAIP